MPGKPHEEFLLGGTAAMGAGFFTNPLEVVKTRMQLQGELKARGQYAIHYRNSLHAFYTIFKSDGIFALQGGLVPALWYQMFMNGVRLGSFQIMTNLGLLQGSDNTISFFRSVIAGASAGCVGAVVGSPFYMVKTHLQCRTNSQIAVGYQHTHGSMLEGFTAVLKEYGIQGLWRGASGAMLRVMVGSAAQLSTFSSAKEYIVNLQTSVDLGGPRKEFFVSALRQIKEHYFDPVREWSGDYDTIGKIMALSILQNGKLPRVLTPELVEELFHHEDCRPVIKHLRKGLDTLGIFSLALKLPTLINIFTPGTAVPLTVKKMCHFLEPIFSEEGSNRKRTESLIYSNFVKYMREVASGRRDHVNLESILRFATGADEEPILGFTIKPTIKFVANTMSFLPTSNTCINRLNLSVPATATDIPSDEFLFPLYDYSFCNNYFGLK